VNLETLRARLQGYFRPFSIITAAGVKHPIPRRDYVLITDRAVVVADAQGVPTELNPEDVVAIEDLEVPRVPRSKRVRRRTPTTESPSEQSPSPESPATDTPPTSPPPADS
jgi:hypothetical protein